MVGSRFLLKQIRVRAGAGEKDFFVGNVVGEKPVESMYYEKRSIFLSVASIFLRVAESILPITFITRRLSTERM